MTEIYIDTGNLEDVKLYSKDKLVKGFTSNPTLIKSQGYTDYLDFAKKYVEFSNGKPVSLEVLSTDEYDIFKQACVLSSLGKNVFVKIPIISPYDNDYGKIIRKVSSESGIQVNVTAVFTEEQINLCYYNLDIATKSIVSIFCGRIADTGREPEEIMGYANYKVKAINTKTLWASCREVYNIYQAQRCYADIITVPPSIYNKYLNTMNLDLKDYSIMTSDQFFKDASGFTI